MSPSRSAPLRRSPFARAPSLFAAVGSFFVACLGAAPCAAQQALRQLDISRLFAEGDAWLAGRDPGALARLRAARPSPDEDSPDERVLRRARLPRPSMVARDWSAAYRIAGADPLVTDLVRPSRSTRMVFARLRLPLGAFAPFAHGGVGLWRADREAVPLFLADTEYAAQLGAGLEVKIARRGAIGFECDGTFFYREAREPQYLPMPVLVGAYAALRAEF